MAGSYIGSYASHDSILLTKSHSKSPFIVSSYYSDIEWLDVNATRRGNSISVLLGMESMQSLISMSQKGERLPVMESMPSHPQDISRRNHAILDQGRLYHVWKRFKSNWDSNVLWGTILATLLMTSIAFAFASYTNRDVNHLGIHLMCMISLQNAEAESAILKSSYSMLSSMIMTGNYVIVFGIGLYLAIQCTRFKKAILANRNTTNLTSVFVLPCYEMIWYALVLLSIYGIGITMSSLHLAVEVFNKNKKTYCFFHYLPSTWMRQLVPFLMIQKSISKAAVLRSIMLSALVSTLMLAMLFIENSLPAFFIVFHCCLIGFYTWVKYVSLARASFDYTYAVLCLTSVFAMIPPILLLFPSELDRSIQLNVFHTAVDAFCILAIMLTLRADTKYWLGIDYNSLHTNDPARVYLRLIAEQGIVSSFSTRTSVYDVHFMIEEFKSSMVDFSVLKLEAVVAQGATAVVLKGSMYQSSKEQTPVAIKMYTSLFVTEDEVRRFSKETAFNVQLSHPNIVRFHGLCVVPPAICLLFEFCEMGSLEAVLDTDDGRSLSLSIRLKMCLDACHAVEYLHSFDPPLLHRDIKTANFLLASDGLLKLSDFGESNLLKPKNDGTMTIVGSVDYMAPEMIVGGRSAVYGTAADVYSLAITMWHILVPGISPWSGRSHFDVYTEIIQGKRPPLPSTLTPGITAMLESGWAPDPRDRLPIHVIVAKLHALWLLSSHREQLKRTSRCGSKVI